MGLLTNAGFGLQIDVQTAIEGEQKSEEFSLKSKSQLKV